jgi:hypothetical protein
MNSTNLSSEISSLYEEINRKRIDLLKGSPNVFKSREVLLGRIKDDIIDAYSKGKITKLHYDLLNEKIAKMTQEKV